jgi:hypothetical protein
MENKKIEIATIVNRESMTTDEPAYLVKSVEFIGVTNDIGDVISFISNCKVNQLAVQIIPGNKKDLLKLQHRILLDDEIANSWDTDRLIIPQKNMDYNIMERVHQGSHLFGLLRERGCF